MKIVSKVALYKEITKIVNLYLFHQILTHSSESLVPGKEAQQQRFVEITMCYHAIYGLSKLRSTKNFDENLQQTFQAKQMENKVFIINFRFIKEFTKGVSSSWTINALNYFKPIAVA